MLVSPLLLTIVLTLSTGIQSYELEQISEIGDRVNALIKTPIAPKGSEGSFAKADGSFGHSINDPLPRQCRRSCGEWLGRLETCIEMGPTDEMVECLCSSRFFNAKLLDKCAKGCCELFLLESDGMKMKDMLAAILKVCRCNGHRLKRADVIVKSLSGDNMIFHSIMAQECPAGMDKHDHDGGCGSSC